MVVVEMLHKLDEKVLLFCPRIVCWVFCMKLSWV
jgi:hypothetical protein